MWVDKHQTTSTVVEIDLRYILGSEKRQSKLPDGKYDCILSSQHWIRSPQASHHLSSCRSWFRNMPAQPAQDHHGSENYFTWSSQHWNKTPRALYNLYSCGNWALGHSWHSNTPAQPPQQWKRYYLIFSALKQEFTSIAQPPHLWKLNLGYSWYQNMTPQPPQDNHKSKNDFIWSYQH